MSALGGKPMDAMRGAALTIAMRWVDRLIGIVSTLILARLLVPADFGIIAMASIVIGLVDVLFDVGVNVALIQNRQATPAHYHTAWTLRLIQAAVSLLIVLAIAPFAADHFGDPRVTAVLQVSGLGLVLAALENIGVVDFQKEMRFGVDFRFTFSKRIGGFAVTMVAAYALQSYWAMVLGSLAGRLIGVGLSYAMHPMRPRLTLACFRDIFAVSQWMMLRSIANYLNESADRFFVGGRADAGTLGGYTLAQQVSAMPSTELLAPLNRVLFPVLARAKDDLAELRRVFLLAQSTQTLVVMPLAVGLAMLAREAVWLMLGAQWLFIVPFVQMLALASIVQSITVSGSYVLLVRGDYSAQTLITALQVVLFALGAWWLLPDGTAIELARLRLVAVVGGMVLSVWLLLRRMPNIRAADVAIAVHRPALGCLGLAGAVLAVNDVVMTSTALPALALKAACGATGYLLVVGLLWWACGRPEGAERFLWQKLRRQDPGKE
jgi:lipopolysaccharide exporter